MVAGTGLVWVRLGCLSWGWVSLCGSLLKPGKASSPSPVRGGKGGYGELSTSPASDFVLGMMEQVSPGPGTNGVPPFAL